MPLLFLTFLIFILVLLIVEKAFIFDWSGTLSDNFHCSFWASCMIFRELGKEPPSEDDFRTNFTLPYMKFWNKHFPDLSKEKQGELYEKFIHLAGEPDLHIGVDETLRFLNSKGCRLFLISSDPVSKLIPEVEKSGLFGIFENVVGNTHDKSEVIVSLIQEFGLDKDSTFYVGDSSGDVEAGKTAGVKTIGVFWGYQPKKVLARSNPDILIDRIIEIKNSFPKL